MWQNPNFYHAQHLVHLRAVARKNQSHCVGNSIGRVKKVSLKYNIVLAEATGQITVALKHTKIQHRPSVQALFFIIEY